MEESSKSKGQSSLEYLLIAAVSLGIIIPTAYLFYIYSKESSQQLSDSQITTLGKTIVDTSESIYYSGKDSKSVLELNIPDNVDKVYIYDGSELVFRIRTSSGDSDIVFFVPDSFKITPKSDCIFDTENEIKKLEVPGLHKVRVQATSAQGVSCILLTIDPSVN